MTPQNILALEEGQRRRLARAAYLADVRAKRGAELTALIATTIMLPPVEMENMTIMALMCKMHGIQSHRAKRYLTDGRTGFRVWEAKTLKELTIRERAVLIYNLKGYAL